MTRSNIQECTLVPVRYFDEKDPGRFLYDVSQVKQGSAVGYRVYDDFEAVLVYEGDKEPFLATLLDKMPLSDQHCRILAAFDRSCLSLAIAQGGKLIFANAFPARDFITAEYFILKTMNSLQLNPEMSTINFCSRLDDEQKISLSCYFYSVAQI